MQAASDVASVAGCLFVPPGLSMDQAMIGLHANLPRMRAFRVIDTARAISMVFGKDHAPRDVLIPAGLDDGQVERLKIQQWRAENRERMGMNGS